MRAARETFDQLLAGKVFSSTGRLIQFNWQSFCRQFKNSVTFSVAISGAGIATYAVIYLSSQFTGLLQTLGVGVSVYLAFFTALVLAQSVLVTGLRWSGFFRSMLVNYGKLLVLLGAFFAFTIASMLTRLPIWVIGSGVLALVTAMIRQHTHLQIYRI
ncbi:MAG: hypothetical protein ABF915_08770, partial [Schleiferilactobacillus harbinensis]